MPDVGYFARKFSQTGPEGQVKMFEDRCSQLVSVVTLWSEDRSDRTRVLLLIVFGESSLRRALQQYMGSRPAMGMTRCSRCCLREGSSLCCACRIPWDSTRKEWTAGSTIRRLVEREKACGLPTALELLFTRKVVKERLARSYISSCAPTLSHTRRLTRDKRIPSGAKLRVARQAQSPKYQHGAHLR